MRTLMIPVLAMVAACSGGDDTTPTDGVEPDPPRASVLRDCPETAGTICPWAGAGFNGYNGDDVHRLDAWFSFPMSVTMHPDHVPIISDWNNHKLREVLDDPEAGYRTVMGTDFLGDGDADLLDSTPAGAPGTDVNLNHPTMQTWFSDGTLLAASWHTHKLRTWDPATGLVHVYLGGSPGFSGIDFDEPADETILNQPKAVLLHPQDENFVYFLDMRNERVRVLDRAAWRVDTVAGTGAQCRTANGDDVGDGGLAVDACFGFPKSDNPEPGGALAMSSDGQTLYIADSENHVIRSVDMTTGIIDTIAGKSGEPDDVDGAGLDARFFYPVSFAHDTDAGVLYIADANNHKIRALDLATHEVTTAVGSGEPSCELARGLLVPEKCDNQHEGGDGGPALEATLYRPFGVDLDPSGNLVIADTYNHRFRIVYR